MGLIQRDALRTMVLSYVGLALGYLNKGVLFILLLSTEEIGLFGLILSLGMLFAQIANLGTINAILKFYHFFDKKRGLNTSLIVLMLKVLGIGVLITTAAAFAFKPFFTSLYIDRSALFVEYYFWIIPLGIAMVLFLFFESILKAMYKNTLPVFANEIVLRILQTIVLLLYGVGVIDFHKLIILSCLFHFVPVVIILRYLIKIGELQSLSSKVKVPKTFRGILVKFGLFSYMNTVGGVAVITLDTTMIASIIGLSGAGVYSIIIFLTSALTVPYKSLLRISTPFIPAYWKERKMREMEQLYKNVSGVGLVISCIVFSLVWINRNELFSLLEPEYLEGIWVFFFLMIGRMVDMYAGMNAIILMTSKKYKMDMLFTFILLLLVFFLNYWLIPIYGIAGAAVSTMIALVAYNVLRLWYVWYCYKMHPFQLNHLWVFLLFLATVGSIELLPANSNIYINMVLQTAAFGIFFVIPLVYFKLEPQLNAYLNKIFGRRLKF